MKNSLVLFVVGIIMVAAGLYWLTSIVTVTSTWGHGFSMGGRATVPSGITLVPLIAGIIWIFFNPKSMAAKILILVGIVIIVAGILLSAHFRIVRTNLFEFIMIFVCLAGGSGLLGRLLLKKPDDD